ncbi:MAG TPA: epoxyqueuosine reductase QueH [Deltaproteobacteria bacterium]|nr:epoxyqueuosine reductase QueH [Deltaproteobacteria bacterium]
MNTVGSMVMSDRKKILLHTCCAPCATYPVELLLSLNTDIVLFFSNANIFPETEYAKRLESARNLSSQLNLSLIEDAYDHHAWLGHIKGLEREPERGRRCIKCFEYSLIRTAMAAQNLSIPCFTTTLTVSRHKPSKVIFEVGSHLAGFCPIDFKKNNGFSQSIELSRKYNLYRQNYCGCEFSMRVTP